MAEYNSDPSTYFRVGNAAPHLIRTLAELYPNEIAFFKKRFVWPCNHGGCYLRYRYETLKRPYEKDIPKWNPLKTRGNWQHLYTELVDLLVEKHLDFEKFWKLHSYGHRLSPDADETAFWFGTMAGLTTYNDCIDLDSHDMIGWNPIPTMWHSSRTGSVNGPYSWRHVPVVRPSLRFFQIAKVIYDHFPNRIWSFSSANFGLAIWKVYRRPKATHVEHRKVEATLKSAGISVEHYPLPAKTGLGKCHRRPCGMDSAIITNDGLITDSIQQIRAYMVPPKTPSFSKIVEESVSGLRRSYELFLREGESLDHTNLPHNQRKFLVESCLKDIDEIERWLGRGCPIDQELISAPVKSVEADDDYESMISEVGASASFEPCTHVRETIDDQYPDFFRSVDLKAVSESGQWVQFVKFLVENGIPTEDKFGQVISALALWFGFVELFGEDPQRTKDVLRHFVLTRHNGMVSRLLAGNVQEVLDHVDRIVDHALASEDMDGKRIFAELRQKRSSGQYRNNHFFESQILRNGMESSSSSHTANNHLSYLLCRGLIADSGENEGSSDWSYQPDDTPLPDTIINQIRQAFRDDGRQIRRNKSGRYPTLDSITRFFNYLFCGRKSGTRRASRKLLEKMGFPKKTQELDSIISVLTHNGLLHKGGYSSGQLSRQWMLGKSVIEAIFEARKQQAKVS